MKKRGKPKFAHLFEPKDGFLFLPEARIITSARAGTSSFYYNLRQHPDFYPKDLSKESFTFSWNWKSDEESTREIWERYKHPVGTFNIDGSPDSLIHPLAPQRSYDCNPNFKFIAMLRDPVIRAHENFWLVMKGHLEEVYTFEEAIEREESRNLGDTWTMFDPGSPSLKDYHYYSYLERSKYAKYLKRWFEYFDREQFFIIKSEDFYTEPQKVFDQFFKFLGIKPFEFKKFEVWWDAALNLGHACCWKVQPLKPETEKMLYDYFRPHNEELSDLLQRDFNWGPSK